MSGAPLVARTFIQAIKANLIVYEFKFFFLKGGGCKYGVI